MPFHVTWNVVASSFHGKMHGESIIGHPIGHLPIQSSQLINVFHATLGCICLFISRGKWGIFHCPSSHSAILINQCLFMPHEENHLPFHLMGKCKGISHRPLCICPFIISPCIHLFMFQTLILLEVNNIWVHTWANEIFEKPCLLEPWRWSHLGQQHKGPLYLYRLGLNFQGSRVFHQCVQRNQNHVVHHWILVFDILLATLQLTNNIWT